MPNETVIKPPRYRALAASTRPVRLRGDNRTTVFTSECLHDLARQVREHCIWLTVEHLDFLPPYGRWREAEITKADDGQEELYLLGEELPHYIAETNGNVLYEQVDRLPPTTSPELRPTLSYDRRNFDRAAAVTIENESECPARGQERWAELPPIEYVLTIPVVWGASKFLGSFVTELGRAAGQSVVSKVQSWSRASKDPKRSVVLVFDFQIVDDVHMRGFVIAPPSDPDGQLQKALENIEPLASLAGLQSQGTLLPGAISSAFFFDGSRWLLGWWTDGEHVVETTWLRQHAPDVAGVLGRPPFWQ